MSNLGLAETPSTSIMLDMLLTRWQQAPRAEAPDACQAEALEHAQKLIVQTVGHCLPHLDPDDQALYQAIVTSPDARHMRERFFACFDLLVRTRGTALAVLRLHELYRLLR
jgi:hypothetical protein